MDYGKTGRYIASRRKALRMTQRELAERLGVTNKAVSKWETGQGMPDVSVLLALARVLDTSVEEILQGGDGEKKADDAQEAAACKDTLSAADCCGCILLFAGFLCLMIQVWFLLKKEEYQIEYITHWMFYVVNGAALMLLMLGGLCVGRLRRFIRKPAVGIAAGLLFVLNIAACLLFPGDMREVTALSPGFGGPVMSLKIDRETGTARLFRPAKGPFARPAEELPFTVAGEVKTQWLERDVCALTYESEEDGGVHQFVATYGDRSDGTAYYYVANALLGTWVGEDGYRLDLTDGPDGGIILETPRGTEVYAYEDCLQYGTLALVLPGQGPKWTLVLNRDCVLKSGETTVNDGGTITLCRVSMKETTPVTMRRIMDGAAG